MTERKMKLGARLRMWARGHETTSDSAPPPPPKFHPPVVMPGVIAMDAKIALDMASAGVYDFANMSMCDYHGFLGYPTLAEMTQRPEYRMLSEKIAAAMVRKWIKLKSKGKGDKSERIARIEEVMQALRIKELFQACAINDGFFGRCQLFIDMGVQDGPTLEAGLFRDKSVMKGKLRKFKLIEAMYTYPNDYTASNPMADDYYNPNTWFVMGQKVHSSRLLTFVGRPVPDMLKPAYNFGGLSMSQMAMPYVDNFLSNRRSVGKMLRSYSTTALATEMDTVLAGDTGDDLLDRADLFTTMRDNQGLMLINKDTEELIQKNVPLTTTDSLLAQSQEQMSSVASTPNVILLGITPTGLNASSDGEIRVFYDHVLDKQNGLFGDNLTSVIEIIQLSEFGDVDPDIVYEFVPLWQQSDDELAKNRKADAETADILITAGVVSPAEVRDKMATDEHSGYNGLAGDPPPPPDNEAPDATTKPG